MSKATIMHFAKGAEVTKPEVDRPTRSRAKRETYNGKPLPLGMTRKMAMDAVAELNHWEGDGRLAIEGAKALYRVFLRECR